MADWLQIGLTAMITGMGVVFAILILIAWIIDLFKFIQLKEKKAEDALKAKLHAVHEHHHHTTHESLAPVAQVQQTNDLEIIAIITAAIAASMNTSVDQLRVTSFKKTEAKRAWSSL